MTEKTGKDRRQVQRFSIQAFAVVKTISPAVEQVFELNTRDISSSGAFFPMEVPLPTGEKVKITLFLSFSALEEIPEIPKKAKIVTDGHVVRSEGQGIAVEFGKHYTMMPSLS
jgi:hypothetical protein